MLPRPGAAQPPFGYVTPNNTARVVYLGSDSHIHEPRLPPVKAGDDADLSALGNSPTPGSGSPFGAASGCTNTHFLQMWDFGMYGPPHLEGFCRVEGWPYFVGAA
jgi:hypothetical protein